MLYTVAGQLIEEVTGKTWEDFMREWIRRDDFHLRIEPLLVGEDPDFQAYFRELVRQERGAMIVTR